jgi:hypothetical protein
MQGLSLPLLSKSPSHFPNDSPNGFDPPLSLIQSRRGKQKIPKRCHLDDEHISVRRKEGVGREIEREGVVTSREQEFSLLILLRLINKIEKCSVHEGTPSAIPWVSPPRPSFP